MGVDFNRIGFGISSGNSRNGFGNIVSFPSVSFPAYGTEISRATNTPYTPAGVMVVVNGVSYYGQKADFVTFADGIGGTYTAWENITVQDASVSPFASFHYTPPYPSFTPVNVPELSNNFDSQYYEYTYYLHDGTGGYTTYNSNINYYSNGTFIGQASVQALAYYGSNSIWNGKYNLTDCRWDGGGSYYTQSAGTSGTFFSYGTFIANGSSYNNNTTYVYYFGNLDNGTWVNTDAWVHDGNGGTTTTMVNGGSYYSYGTYIGNDGMNNYAWDGNGGYYTY